ncbi:MAG: DNA-3-methyladenine glycosylase 2 family protein [Chitinophagales bacterium]
MPYPLHLHMEIIDHLKQDSILAPVIEKHGPLALKKQKNTFLYLSYSIMSQQLSTKVADVLRSRFLALYSSKQPGPQEVWDTEHNTLRSIGLSNAKAQYIRNVARFALDEGMEYNRLQGMDDEAVIQYLTRIKGVGKWTVEMLLMFALERENVFPFDDLGIQTAMRSMYRIRSADKKFMYNKMHRIAAQWTPYRSYACLYLWRSRDSK